MTHMDANGDRSAVAGELKQIVDREKDGMAAASLDDLIELLDADDLRNVVGMVRPKGKPGMEG